MDEIIDPIKRTDVLPISFLYLKLVGAWKPLDLPKCLRLIYDLFTIFMVIFICKLLIISDILCVVFAEENRFAVFKGIVHVTITHLSGWIKMLHVLSRRRSIMLLVNGCVAKQWNPPRDRHEASILTSFDNSSRRTTIAYTIQVSAAVSMLVLSPVFSSTWFLPIDNWYPCNISSPICFWPSYVHQSMGIVAIAVAHVATDTLIVGFMIQICTQLNILNHRLLSIHIKLEDTARRQKNQEQISAVETLLVNECISHYIDILKFADLLSKTFVEVVFIQFCVGFSVICSIVYLLAILSILSFDFFGTLFYLGGMLSQMFIYCWYGNEVVLNSTKLFHTIYNMNWVAFQIKTQKKLLLMMLVALSPIQLFEGAIIKVNLDAFINVLKFSYSAFNILQKSS
ncbi:odorant receptor 111 isoform X1 [Nasonia vitripennis]|uniref:Odorant receptor n=1 Tax=Nasonia vitripennis TaxID=7425 RepID=A0A7M7J0J6_NASVI|nr:odorant receptor 111 [Nasonia vitripennis]XP_016841654.1 odorant receptor 111 isoform X1 [Nasonia vitripennis]